MAVTYDKKQREIAKQKGWSLITIAVDGRAAKLDGIEFQGPVDREAHDEVAEFLATFLTKRKGKL